MAAAQQRPGPSLTAEQVKIRLLLVGDVTVVSLAEALQRLFSSSTETTITISQVRKVASLLQEDTFHMVFLKISSLPIAEELEAVRLIRFAKKRNTHLLFVLIIPENFANCIAGHGADIILTEPLTVEKMSILVNYWKICFSKMAENEAATRPEERGSALHTSCSEQRRRFSGGLGMGSESLDDIEFGSESPLSDLKKSQKSSVLHSNKEKLRRERIKDCCEQLRTLLPYTKGRKNDVASILEATVDYMKCIREKIPSAVMGQITEVLQRNWRFRKMQQLPSPACLPGPMLAHRGSSVLTTSYSPLMDLRLLTRNYDLEYPIGGFWDLEEIGLLDPTSESVLVNMCEDLLPCVSLTSFHAAMPAQSCSEVAPSHKAVKNQSFSVPSPSVVPKVSRFLPQHCSSLSHQTCATCPDHLQQF